MLNLILIVETIIQLELEWGLLFLSFNKYEWLSLCIILDFMNMELTLSY